MFLAVLRTTISPYCTFKDQYAATHNTLRFMGRWTIALGSFAIISGLFNRTSWALFGLSSCATSAAISAYFYNKTEDVDEDDEYEDMQKNTISVEYKIAVLTSAANIVATFACFYFNSPNLDYFKPLLDIGLTSTVILGYHYWQFTQAKNSIEAY